MTNLKLNDSVLINSSEVRDEFDDVNKTNTKSIWKRNEYISSKELLNKFSRNLGIIAIISAFINLILIGIVVLVVNNLISNAVTEQYKQISSERNAFTAFMEKKSSTSNLKDTFENNNNVYGDKPNNFGTGISQNKNHVMPLHLLYNAPMNNLEKVDAIIFEFEEVDENNRGKIHQNMYHIESISREIPKVDEQIMESESILKFNLSDNNRLIMNKEGTILKDKNGKVIHQVIYSHYNEFQENNSSNSKYKQNSYEHGGANRLLRIEEQIVANNSNNSKIDFPNMAYDYYNNSKRRLISTNSHRHNAFHSLKTQSAYMAAVCKYGCGEMGVTYPYYYRPFFGYGFPLLGTEPYFQSGYGGNVETAMNNNMFNPESSIPRPPGVQGTPSTSPFSMNENPYSYPYSASPGGGYYYYYVYPNPTTTNNQEIYDPNYYYDDNDNYKYQPNLNSTETL